MYLKIKKNRFYNRPFSESKTQAMAKKPIPTVTNPQPAMSLYLNAPIPIRIKPIIIINNVAQPNIEFLFVDINFYLL